MKASEKAVSIRGVTDDLNYLKGEFTDASAPTDRDGILNFDMLVDFVDKHQHELEHLIQVVRTMEKIK